MTAVFLHSGFFLFLVYLRFLLLGVNFTPGKDSSDPGLVELDLSLAVAVVTLAVPHASHSLEVAAVVLP